jgi:GNAT superfamily N-acetyltransferase
VEAHVAPRSTPANLERLARLVAEADPERRANFVAVSRGEVVGMCRPYCDETGRCHVGAIYVEKAWHGKGVGAVLMERLLEWVGPEREVELQVATYNGRARRFYSKWGFAEKSGTEALYEGVIEEVTMVRPAERRSTQVDQTSEGDVPNQP